MSGRLARLYVVAAMSLTGMPGSGAAAPAPVPCEAFGSSPAFATDGQAMCVARHDRDPSHLNDATDVYVTRDRARTWTRAAAMGLTTTATTSWAQVVFSPRYQTDRTVYVVADNEGLFRTTDLGGSFELVDPLVTTTPSWYGPPLSPFVTSALADVGDPVPPVGSTDPRTVLAYMGALPARVDPPLHVPAAASGDDNRWFLVPPGFPADKGLVLARHSPRDPTWHYVAYECNGVLVCSGRRFDFPAAEELAYAGLDAAYATNRTAYIALYGHPVPADHFDVQVWRSTDAGKSFLRWRELEQAMAPFTARLEPDRYSMSLTTAPALRATYLFVAGRGNPTKGTRGRIAALYRSTDGRRWTRLGYRNGTFDWASGAMPVGGGDGYWPAGLWPLPTGPLVALGRRPASFGTYLYCSLDAGRTWRPTCR